MRLIDMGENLSWAKKFKGMSVVYLLRWDGKNYIGSSTNLPSRLYWWRGNMPEVPIKAKVLLVCSRETRHFYEERAIAAYGTVKNGHNKTKSGKPGGVHGHAVSEGTRKKISQRRVGFKFSEEVKLKMSESAKRRGAHSKETYEKVAAKLRGRTRDPEIGRKISASRTGVELSESHKQALKEAWARRRLKLKKECE